MNCLGTDNLCIEQMKLKLGPNRVYYPTNQIPVFQDIFDYRLKLYGGPQLYQCSKLPPLQSYPMDRVVRVSNYIAYAVINVTLPLPMMERYHLELSDQRFNQCILGPSVNGSPRQGVEIDFPTKLVQTTTISNGIPTVISQDPGDSDHSWPILNIVLLCIAAVIIQSLLLYSFYRLGKSKRRTNTVANSPIIAVLDHRNSLPARGGSQEPLLADFDDLEQGNRQRSNPSMDTITPFKKGTLNLIQPLVSVNEQAGPADASIHRQDSISSTIESFKTASEGRNIDDDGYESEEFSDDSFNRKFGNITE